MTIQRKYNFQYGSKISSTQMNDELNQLVNEVNDKYSKTESDLKFAKKQQSSWIPLTLQNGWQKTSNYETPPSYMVDEIGNVNFRGSIYGGIITNDTVLFVIPAEIRPYYWQRLGALNWDGGSNSKEIPLLVHVNGNVSIRAASWNNFIILDGLSYRLEG